MTDPAINWLSYQKAWIKDQSRFKIGMVTRRGGKTFGAGGEVVDDCIEAEIGNYKTRWTILSRSELAAKEVIAEAVRPMTEAYYAAYKLLSRRKAPVYSEGEFLQPAHTRMTVDGEVFIPAATYRTHEVTYPGGSRVMAISANPDAARGFGGNLLLDEFAFHMDSRAIWRAAMPVAARGKHKVRAISTPNGRGNKFYELMTAGDSTWSRHIVDIYEAVKQGLPVDIDELRAAINDEEAWGQEFELKWLDTAAAWLTYELIASAEYLLAGAPGLYQGGPCYVGVDIGARKDLYVIWVLEAVDGQLITREIVEIGKGKLRDKHKRLAEVFAKYHVVRCFMDQTGMGEKPVEDAQAEFGESRVQGVLFSVATKLDMATVMKEGMEDGTFLIPAGRPVLRADLNAVKSVIGTTGNRRLLATGDTDGHADRFWAGALAATAANLPYQPMDYRPVTLGGAGSGDLERPVRATRGIRAIRGLW